MPTPRPVRLPGWVIPAGSLLVVLLAAVAYFSFRTLRLRTADVRPRLPERRTILVMPFASHRDPEGEYLARGFTDDLLLHLSALGYLSPVPRPASRREARDAARELGADLVLEASLDRAGERLRLAARLTDVATGAELIAPDLERPLQEAAAIPAALAAAIAGVLGIPAVRTAGLGPVSGSAQAYDYYLQGRRYLWDSHRADAYELSGQALARAVQADPGYALAYAALAQVEAQSYWNIRAEAARLDQAEAAASRALELAPDLPEAWLALAQVRACRGDWNQAAAYAGRALEQRSSDAWIHATLSWIYTWRQPPDPDAVRRHAEEAVRLAPDLGPAHVQLARGLAMAGRHGEAGAALERALEWMPNSFLPHLGLAELYLATSRYGPAREELEIAVSLVPDAPLPCFYLACLNAAEGRTEDALEAWEAAAAKGFHEWDLAARIPYLESIRSEERFAQVLDQAR